jgi:hypothetical protein
MVMKCRIILLLLLKQIRVTLLFTTSKVDKLGVFVVFISTNNAQYIF